MITVEEWEKHCARVTREMSQYVQQFATPLSMSEEHGSGTAWGSGTYVAGPDATWVLTAEHVINSVPSGGRLAHLPRDGADYNAAFGQPQMAAWPIDSAALPIFPDENVLPPLERILPLSSIDGSYSTADEELLFWYGFPGYSSLERNDPRLKDKLIKSHYNHLVVRGKPMISQAIRQDLHVSASNFDPSFHVAVHYPVAATRATDGQMIPLPNAAGMSGSALWDTKFVACALEGKPWSPELARVCGVVWAVFDNPDVVFATKIEHVRKGLPGVF
nr:hypothetical protein [uncultured Duganella sp.]